MKTINIKGRPYVQVSERVLEFRTNPDFAGWSMTDEVLDFSDAFILIRTTIADENGVVRATGIAQEFRDASNINKTSYVENCETSAWGRALANLGLGIDANVASAEEVAEAIQRQETAKEIITKTAADALIAKADAKHVDISKILTAYKVAEVGELTVGQWTEAVRRLDLN